VFSEGVIPAKCSGVETPYYLLWAKTLTPRDNTFLEVKRKHLGTGTGQKHFPYENYIWLLQTRHKSQSESGRIRRWNEVQYKINQVVYILVEQLKVSIVRGHHRIILLFGECT